MTDDFTTFVHETQGGAYRLALALCAGDEHEASDLLQAAFERLWARWHRLRLTDPAAYLRAVVVRTHATRRRRASVRRERAVPELPESTATGPQETYAESAVLMRALAALPRRQRQAVVLRYLEDLPVAEVATLMSCTTGTVKRAAYDGLRTLRSRMAPEYERGEVTDA